MDAIPQSGNPAIRASDLRLWVASGYRQSRHDASVSIFILKLIFPALRTFAQVRPRFRERVGWGGRWMVWRARIRVMAVKLTSAQRYGPGWAALRLKVFAVKGRVCVWCGAPATHIDHVLPRCRGGLAVMSNLVPSCQFCNLSRGGRDSHYRPPLLPLMRASRDW